MKITVRFGATRKTKILITMYNACGGIFSLSSRQRYADAVGVKLYEIFGKKKNFKFLQKSGIYWFFLPLARYFHLPKKHTSQPRIRKVTLQLDRGLYAFAYLHMQLHIITFFTKYAYIIGS